MNIAFYVSGNAGRIRGAMSKGYEDMFADTKLIFSDDSQNIWLEDVSKKSNINYELLDYKNITDLSISKNLTLSNQLLEALKKNKIDYCFSFGAHILTGDLLNQYENKIINFHPSILPMYPGKLSIDTAVEAGSNLLGNTAHFIDRGIDTGPIIMQNIVSSKVFSDNNYDVVLDNQIPMLHQIYKWLKNKQLIIEGRKVTIYNANYNKSVFYPEIENESK